MTTRLRAWAKINLTLHICGQRADGYHLLDSLVVFADIGDRLVLTPGPEMGLSVTGPFAAGVPTDQRNLVWQAAELAGWHGHIELEKNLPHGAGLGGGSADAAAILAGLGAPAQALTLGADVPVCLSCQPQRMQGIGEDLTTLHGVPSVPLVLINPQIALPTGPVFGALTQRNNPPMEGLPTWSSSQEFVDWAQAQRNDLEVAAQQLCPAVTEVLEALQDALLARMTGSGSSCFGIFADENAASAAARRIAQAHPGWWVRTARSFGSDPALTGVT